MKVLLAMLTTVIGCLAAAPVNVLVLAGKLEVDQRLADELTAADIHVVHRPAGEPLSPELLRLFHVVVIADGSSGAHGTILPPFVSDELTVDRNLGMIADYVRDGGGLFVSPDLGGENGAARDSRLLAPYGARVDALQVRDDAHRWVPDPPPDREAGYAWTTEVAKHPATSGVNTIFYPTPQHRWDDFYSTAVVELLDPAWQALVRGMDTSSASRGTDYIHWQVVRPTPPPIAAVRTVAKGRVGILAVMSYYTLWHPYWTAADHEAAHTGGTRGHIGERTTGDIDGIFMEKGDGTRRSQGRELLIGMFRWLAEGARTAGMGDYTPAALAAVAVPEKVPAPVWPFRWEADPPQRNFKLLVGARSAASDGAGSLAEYAAAARAAGVDVLVMTETFAAFDPAQWPAYFRACRDLSDQTLMVMPGLDIADFYGARYLLLDSPVFPQPFMLTPDGKALQAVQYLCLCFPDAITIAHRVTSSPIPHELIKHFQGIGIYTYNAAGELVDNSLPAWEWELNSFSNPIPFAVHEITGPDQVAAAATTGHQVYGVAPTLADLVWYLERHGTAHFWESPVHFQVSSGPLLTAFGRSPFLRLESAEPLREVRLHSNYRLYRRWLPAGQTEFTVPQLALPRDRIAHTYLTAIDEKGGELISPGLRSGAQAGHTWRCGDRQNWFSFPNIYTGTCLAGIDLRVPAFGTPEGRGGYLGFAEFKGPQRGDNVVPILDFPLASLSVYIQDAWLDQRYWHAVAQEIIFDAKPAHATVRSRVFRGHVRYQEFREVDNPSLPILKEVDVALRRPVVVETDIYPTFTSMNLRNQRLWGDRSYAYTDPTTGEAVTGTLAKGTIDIPTGGRVGGLIVVDGPVRVGADSRVGWAAPATPYTCLPTRTAWQASFLCVPPDQAEQWRRLCGFAGATPYTIAITRGSLDRLAFIADCTAADHGVAGAVTTALPPATVESLVASVSEEPRDPPRPLRTFRLPLRIAGVNENWPAALWRPAGEYADIPVFEDRARARLDLTRSGDFYAGNVLVADAPELRIGILAWRPDILVIQVDNPTDRPLAGAVRTVAAIADRLQAVCPYDLAPGTSQVITHRAPREDGK